MSLYFFRNIIIIYIILGEGILGMYAVIFKAKTNKKIDSSYSEMASKLREKAFNQFRCQDFTSVTEGEDELTISYWKSLEDIKSWKQDSEHLIAQKMGIEKWYKSYKVEVVEVLKESKME